MPLTVPFHPALTSLGIKPFFSYTTSPQRLKMRKVLIENKILTLSIENYNFINDTFIDLLLIFLETNSYEFIEEVGTFELDSSIISKLIDSRVFTPEQKMSIIDHIPETVLMENKVVSNKACKFLANNRKTSVSLDLLKDLLTQSQTKEDKIRLFNIYQSEIVGKRRCLQ